MFPFAGTCHVPDTCQAVCQKDGYSM